VRAAIARIEARTAPKAVVIEALQFVGAGAAVGAGYSLVTKTSLLNSLIAALVSRPCRTPETRMNPSVPGRSLMAISLDFHSNRV
jgi:hypothetical protein